MTKLPIVNYLMNHASKHNVSFHMPGHKGSFIYKKYGYDYFLQNIMDCDLTELPGADNLLQPTGIINQTQDDFAKLYGVQRSYLLINGSSGGVIASIMGSVPKGKKLVIARNCHKSAFNALIMAGIEPVYAYPDIISKYGIAGDMPVHEIERCLDEIQLQTR